MSITFSLGCYGKWSLATVDMVLDRLSLWDYLCRVSAYHRYLFSRYDLSATSKGHVINRWGGAEIYIFLKTTYTTLSSCKILAHSDNFEFWRFWRTPSKIRGRGSWVWSMSTFKMAAMDSQDLDLEEKHHVAPPPPFKKWAGQREQKVLPYLHFPPTYSHYYKWCISP